MKITFKKEVQKFTPIDITLKVETKRELELVLSIFNASYRNLSKFLTDNKPETIIADFEPDELVIKSFQDVTKWNELHDYYKNVIK